MFDVTVVFRIHPDKIEDFLLLMMAQARNSLTREEGCHVFDVCQSEETPEEKFLYEVYEDRAAFDVHLESDHFAIFDKAVAELVDAKFVDFSLESSSVVTVMPNGRSSRRTTSGVSKHRRRLPGTVSGLSRLYRLLLQLMRSASDRHCSQH